MKSSVLFLFCILIVVIDGRPDNSQEANLSPIIRFLYGCYNGYATILSLAGYYDYDLDAENKYYELYPEQREGYNKNSNFEKDDDDEEEEEEEDNGGWEPTKMQLVCLGLGRTGSTSLALGIEDLGYTVIHDDEHVELRELYEWYEDGEISWDELNGVAGQIGFNATFKTGWEWAKVHPEVKVILTVRDSAEKYAESWLKAVTFIDIIERMPYRWMRNSNQLYESFYDEYKMETTNNQPEMYKDKETLKQVYEEYNAVVKANIPSERLLVFNVKQGWEPLCQFLEIEKADCPSDIPFPHVHDRMKLLGENFVVSLFTYIWPLVIILPFALPYYFFFHRCRSHTPKKRT